MKCSKCKSDMELRHVCERCGDRVLVEHMEPYERLYIDSATDRNAVIVALVNAGYTVYYEERRVNDYSYDKEHVIYYVKNN